MQAGVSAARQARARYRHEIRALTYVMLDQANGGIVRNLTHKGMGVKAVAGVHPRQQVRVRFELRHPRLRLETVGEVEWVSPSGQCGIRFIGLPSRTIRQIDEWIFGNLLEGSAPYSERSTSVFGDSRLGESNLSFSSMWALPNVAEMEDGLVISPAPSNVIALPAREEFAEPVEVDEPSVRPTKRVELDWLSRPLSGRSLAWTINTLVVVAATMLCVLVFLSVTREPPKWPLALAFGAAIFVAASYWGFFWLFGGGTLGSRLSRLAAHDSEEDEEDGDARFR